VSTVCAERRMQTTESKKRKNRDGILRIIGSPLGVGKQTMLPLRQR
jgi:hypothetical protein